MRRRTGPTPRAGYTLVELLIVIAIIAILAALLTSALTKVRQSMKKTTATSELTQLDAALTSFQLKHGFYPPSHVGFTPATGGPQIRRFRWPTRTDAPEFAILKRMFPRWSPPLLADGVTIDMATIAAPPPAGLGHSEYQQLATRVSRNLDSSPTAPPSPAGALDPNEVMVLFLGGPGTLLGPSSGFNPGWDTAGPYAPTGNTRIDPYYTEFVDARLKNPDTGAFDGRYRDPWGVPYAYFSADAGTDRYDPRLCFPWTPDTAAGDDRARPTFNPNADPNNGEGPTPSHVGTKTNTAHPLATNVTPTPSPTDPSAANIRWHNPKKVQIFSAGPDKIWGRGSYLPTTGFRRDVLEWKPGVGNGYGEGEAGNDDIANFNSGTALGAQGS